LQAVVQSMKDVATQLSVGPTVDAQASAMLHHTARYEALVAEKHQVIRRLSNDLKKRLERQKLMANVKVAVSAPGDDSEMRNLAKEQDSLMHTGRRLNEILSNAELSRDRLRAQRQRFESMTDRVVGIAERVPFINSVLKRIDQKRRRDAVILGIVVAICLILVILFW